MKIEERNKKFYTEEGLEALITRTKTLIRLYNENKFPINEIMLGFGRIKIKDKEECLNRIKELCDLTGFQVEQVKITDGNEIKEELKY